MLYRGLESCSKFDVGGVLAIGNFDGLHYGHQALIKKLVEIANTTNKKSYVILFEPHPKEFFNVQGKCSRVMSLRQKYYALRSMGVDYVICLSFNERLISMSHIDFYNKILRQTLKVSGLVLGENFRFGKNRLGDIKFLRQHTHKDNILLEIISSLRCSKEVISSTLLRSLLLSSDFSRFKKLTGVGFSIFGKIYRSKGLPCFRFGAKFLPLDGLYSAYICILDRGVDIIIKTDSYGRYVYILDSDISLLCSGILEIKLISKINDVFKHDLLLQGVE